MGDTIGTNVESQETTARPADGPNPPQTISLEKLQADRSGELTPSDTRAGFTNAGSFALLQRGARIMAESSLLPDTYKGNIPNCAIALEMAQRLGASPLMICQNLFLVHGRPAWSSQFLIACLNQCGRYSALRYEWVGKPGSDDWGCRAWAIDLSTKERVSGPLVTIQIAKKEGWYSRNGSKWQTLPELMLTYRAATFFTRTNAPELTMGLPTREEREDTIDLKEVGPGSYAIADLQRASTTTIKVDGETVNKETGEVIDVPAGNGNGKQQKSAQTAPAESETPAPGTKPAPPAAAEKPNGKGKRFSF